TSAISLAHLAQHTFADQVGLLAPSRRVRRHVDPDLKNVGNRHAAVANHSAKHRLWRRSLPKNDVRRFARRTRSQIPPSCQVRRLNPLDIHVPWYAVNEPQL